MSAGNSPQRARMLEALGAEVVLVPQVDGAPGQVTGADVAAAAYEAQCLALKRGGFYDQFHASEGMRAHYETTGPEIWKQSGGRVDAWVASVGTGATFLGVAAALRESDPRVLCAAVERRAVSPSPVCLWISHAISFRGVRRCANGTRLMDMSLTVSAAEAEHWKHVLAQRRLACRRYGCSTVSRRHGLRVLSGCAVDVSCALVALCTDLNGQAAHGHFM